MTVVQNILVFITAIVFLIIGTSWIFSDASVGNTLDGLISIYLVIGIPVFLIYKVLEKSK